MKCMTIVTMLVWTPACAQIAIGPGTTLQTPAYAASQSAICAGAAPFPAMSPLTLRFPEHILAASGTPKIEQYRGGKLIATYSALVNQPGCSYQGNGLDATDPGPAAASGCGAFTREHSNRMYEPGDTFKLYPAVYTDQPYIGPQYGDPVTPDNVTLEGVIENNVEPVILLNGPSSDNTLDQAPVYWTTSTNFTIAHIAIAAVQGAEATAGLYINGAAGGKLLDVRITGFEVAGGPGQPQVGADGILSTTNSTGTFTLDQVELDHNGGTGTSGNNHNAYFTGSTDPKYTVIMLRSWSHDAYYGHLFKSRAPINKFEADYFQGGTPQGGDYQQAEAYDVDIPNGGNLAMANVIISKSTSGANSNPIELTFGEEGNPDGRKNYIDLRNTTFVADALTIDGAISPVALRIPDGTPARLLDNVFAGFCPAGTSFGYVNVLALPSDLSPTGGLIVPVLSDDQAVAAVYPNYKPIIGHPTYVPALHSTRRTTASVGAED